MLNGPFDRRISRLCQKLPLSTQLFHPINQFPRFVLLDLSDSVLVDFPVIFGESFFNLSVHVEITSRLGFLGFIRWLTFCRLLFSIVAGSLSVVTSKIAPTSIPRIGNPTFGVIEVCRLPVKRKWDLLELIEPTYLSWFSAVWLSQIRNVIVFYDFYPLWFHKLSLNYIFGLSWRFGVAFALGFGSRFPLIWLCKLRCEHVHPGRPSFSRIKLRGWYVRNLGARLLTDLS